MMGFHMTKRILRFPGRKWAWSGLAFLLLWSALATRPLAAQEGVATSTSPTGDSPAVSGDGNISVEIEPLRHEMNEKPGETTAVRLGQLLLRKGDLDGALGSFEDALRFNPCSFEARIGKGIVLGRRGEYGKAENILRDALVLNPKPARVHYELGLIYEKQGDFGKAIVEYKEGLKKYREGEGMPY